MEKMITISLKEYAKLLSVDSKLDALECAGVDNWEGYGEVGEWEEADEIYEALIKNKCYIKEN